MFGALGVSPPATTDELPALLEVLVAAHAKLPALEEPQATDVPKPSVIGKRQPVRRRCRGHGQGKGPLPQVNLEKSA